MGRVIIGSGVAAVAMFILSFILFATPLYRLAIGSIDNVQAAAVQQAMAANLSGTGTYHVPTPSTPEQTVMYGQGPIATVHYNIGGFSPTDPSMMVGGLLLAFLVALLMGTALNGIDRRVADFASRARLVLLLVVALSAFMHLGQPIMFNHGWGYFIYLFLADVLILGTGGIILARWFLTRANAAPEGAPADV